MGKNRLEAFTDGVVAIIITIMVLELKLPEGHDWPGLLAAAPSFLIYAFSFLNVGIFWNNHHHMLHATREVNGTVLWANMLLLFWLSLVPFVIRWIGEAGIAPLPIASYGFVLTMSAIFYYALERTIIAVNAQNGYLAEAIGHEWKGLTSLAIYVAGMVLAFVSPWIALALYLGVSLIWFTPDRRIERAGRARPPER